ncbi:hypothetical protein [Streptomyces sp. NPDC054863]
MPYPRLVVTAATAALLTTGLLSVPATGADSPRPTVAPAPTPPPAPALAPAPAPALRPVLAPKRVYLHGRHVNLREFPRTSAHVLATKSRIWLLDYCQTDRNTTPVRSPDGTKNRWWSKVTLPAGSDFAWVSNVYLRGGKKIAGVPVCGPGEH